MMGNRTGAQGEIMIIDHKTRKDIIGNVNIRNEREQAPTE